MVGTRDRLSRSRLDPENLGLGFGLEVLICLHRIRRRVGLSSLEFWGKRNRTQDSRLVLQNLPLVLDELDRHYQFSGVLCYLRDIGSI